MGKEVKQLTFRQFMQLAFSENGSPSSKRVVGGLLVFSVCIVTIICACLGYVEFIPEVLQTSLITGAALLGLSSVTSIWKKGDDTIHTTAGGKDNEATNEE